MKIVVNGCYGIYGLSREAIDIIETEGDDIDDRTSEILISLVESDAKRTSGRHASLRVVQIPDSATDYTIVDYDGRETVYYVVGGKIYSA